MRTGKKHVLVLPYAYTIYAANINNIKIKNCRKKNNLDELVCKQLIKKEFYNFFLLGPKVINLTL